MLLWLPCKIGDTIYVIPSKVNYDLNILNGRSDINKIYNQEVYSIEMYNNESYLLTTCGGFCCVRSNALNENWFLTKEEAEKALAERKDSNAENN